MSVTEDILSDGGSTEAAITTWLGGDDHTNFEPVHDDAEDIDSDDVNHLVKGLAECAIILRAGNLVPIPFEETSIAASATTQADLCGTGKTTILIPKDGILVGITAKYSSAITSGTLTVQPQVGGVNTLLNLELSSAAQSAREHQIPANADATDAVDASALEEIEIDITSASLNPASGDVHGMAWFAILEEI